MEEKIENYDFSFFKPTTKLAKFNRNITLSLVSVWAIAIFGFQFLLKIVEKPTPEIAYTQFEGVWEKVNDGTASSEDQKVFISSALSVLGKLAIKEDDKLVLENAVNYSFSKLIPDSLKDEFLEKINSFDAIKKDTATKFSDEVYIQAKELISITGSAYAGFEAHNLKAKLLPFVLNAAAFNSIEQEMQSKVPSVMSKYLIHNQSFLTDFRLFGFPFHYFYTAVFLLILFVALCWLYCYRIDKTLVKLEVTESV